MNLARLVARRVVRHDRAWLALLSVACITLSATTARAAATLPQASSTASAVFAPAPPPGSGPALVVGLPDFTRLVRQVGPAVVNIRTYTRAPDESARQDAQTREFLRRFFGIPLPPGSDGGTAQTPDEERPVGVGSGFILASDGYVLTNAHVVDGAERIVVTLTDHREFTATLVGADARTDVALLKIDAAGLPAVRIGDSSRLQVGEWVVAIGSPFGLDNTVTAGIVSAKSRDTGDYTPLIQTDVAVNPGNSGGPLIDMHGRVVGMNSQIYSRTGGFMGISFAVPIDQAMAVARQLKASGHVVRGKIGVVIGDVSRQLAQALGLGTARGALVSQVEKGGAADAAGVRPGDIITAIDGHEVRRSSDLPRLVGAIHPGTRVSLDVLRPGGATSLRVIVGSWSDKAPAAAPIQPSPAARSPVGVGVVDLNREQLAQLGLRGGVLVESVDAYGSAAGLRVGDVIEALNASGIATASQFDAQLAKLPGDKAAALLVRRGQTATYVLVHPRKVSE
ncbi:Do family serine endopeptidase [Thiomonas sp.]|uniref:Do family serine endopeptidase n=1 Tax=Thiomonas sp. TaxID=2047785 RepID=UPI00260E5B79|nr:Do family serine endopeptidase [Thiomonas sp.]